MTGEDWHRARRLTVSEQRLLHRHGRSLAAVALFHMVLVVAFWVWGTLDAGGLYVSLLLGALALMTVLYLLLTETGLTADRPEPSLSVPMGLGLVVAFLVTALPMNEGRISAMILFFPLLLLVSFRLGARALLSLASLASLGYALMLSAALATRGLRLSLSLELLQWLVFTLVAISFAVTGSGVNGLRRSLAVKNQALADALEQVRDLAIRDDLTGLFNRRHIMEVLEHQKALADNQVYPFSVCYVDLDYFKRINDEYGHDMGDRVLRQFAEQTLENLREGDYLARLGGEEFILVLPQSDLAGAELVAERLRESWAARDFQSFRGPPGVSLSAGVACYRTPETVDQLLARADHALYQAKTGGRNRVCREDDS